MIRFIKTTLAILLMGPAFMLAFTLAVALVFATLATFIAAAVMAGIVVGCGLILYKLNDNTKKAEKAEAPKPQG